MPSECILCNAHGGITPAGFQTLYRQRNSEPIALKWFECARCHAYFVHPIPEPDAIASYWDTVPWADSQLESVIVEQKLESYRRLLSECVQRTSVGPLLDFGCSFGAFLAMASDAGWEPSGFDASNAATVIAKAKGFDVLCGWSLNRSGFARDHFAAVIANDVFYYVWRPFETLRTFYRLLRAGGVLGMRISNKRFWLHLVKYLSPEGIARNARASRLMRGEFHSVGLRSLKLILGEVGFTQIEFVGNATTAPRSQYDWKTRARCKLV